MTAIEIAETDARTGVFEARHDGRLICRDREPFFTAARILVAEGFDPDAVVLMRHRGTTTIALRTRLGKAAGLTVSEGDARPPRVTRWKPYPLFRVASPARFPDVRAPEAAA